MLSPDEATPRALSMLTMAHEIYSTHNYADVAAQDQLTDAQMMAVLADDSGEIDWEAIAVALAMLGHVLLDTIPEALYAATETAMAGILARHFRTDPAHIDVTINQRLTGSDLLRHLSLHVMRLES